MTKDEKRCTEILDSLYTELKTFNQGSIFGTTNTKKIVDLCVEYLKFNGYVVTEPTTVSVEVKSIDELISLFYSRLNNKRGNTGAQYFSYHKQGRDRSIASAFVNSRMELTGNSFNLALQECANIVNTVIDNETEFRFKYELVSFSVFGQKNLKWVSEKAIDIMNKKIGKKIEEREEKLVDEVISFQDASDLGFSDLDTLVEKLEEVKNGQR